LIRILLDQGLPRSTASNLQGEKWDILHVGDIGLSKAQDTELIEYARENGRVIITLDSDFHAFIAVTNAESPSVIRIRIEGLKGPDMALLIRQIWPKIEFYVNQGAMVTVTEKSIRIHKLPLS
jgi:predicted nuclease of predicted toxin-antitoxin system